MTKIYCEVINCANHSAQGMCKLDQILVDKSEGEKSHTSDDTDCANFERKY